MLKKWLAAVLVMIVALSGQSLPAKADGNEVALTSQYVSSYSNNNDVYYDRWNSKNLFEDTDGNIVERGIGFSPYYSSTYRMYTTFNVTDFNYSTLETKISLENGWRTGDKGTTAFIIYADNKKLYTKSFNNLTPAQDLKLQLPAGTRSITFYVVQEKGSQGGHGAIFGNPKLTNSLQPLPKSDNMALGDIGPSGYSDDDDWRFGGWSNGAFRMADDTIVARGYGFHPYYSSTYKMFMTFTISDYTYTTLETNVSLEKGWAKGDRGKSQVVVYANNKLLYSKTFTNQTPVQSLKLPIPKGTVSLTLAVVQAKGSQGNHGVIFENPLLTNALPASSAVDSVALSDIGLASYSDDDDVHLNGWGSSPFEKSDGTLVARGYGLDAYYSFTTDMYSSVYVGDYNYNALETNVSIDNKWRTGDFGKTTVMIYADGKVIYKREFTNGTPAQHVLARIPAGTKYVKFRVVQNKGSKGSHGVIFENPVLLNKPISAGLKASQVKAANNKGKADTVTVSGIGKTDVFSVYDAKGNVLGTSSKGAASLSVKQLGTKAGTIYVTRTQDGMLESTKTAVAFKNE